MTFKFSEKARVRLEGTLFTLQFVDLGDAKARATVIEVLEDEVATDIAATPDSRTGHPSSVDDEAIDVPTALAQETRALSAYDQLVDAGEMLTMYYPKAARVLFFVHWVAMLILAYVMYRYVL